MPSLVDIFNPSFFMFLGILVLVAALLVVYFESKMREQNHKMTSMLALITCVADEMNSIKIHLNNPPNIGGTQVNPSGLETNNIHIIKTNLITVSDDSDTDSENSIDENSDSDSDSESNSEDVEDVENLKEIIELGEYNDVKVFKLSVFSINDIDENKNENSFDDLNDLEDIEEDDNCVSDHSLSVSSDDEDIEHKNNIDISNLNLKSINISNLEEVKNSDNIDYKKFTLSKLRSIVVEKELVADSSKLKKPELLKLLGAE
jgi:hypothetical protein